MKQYLIWWNRFGGWYVMVDNHTTVVKNWKLLEGNVYSQTKATGDTFPGTIKPPEAWVMIIGIVQLGEQIS